MGGNTTTFCCEAEKPLIKKKDKKTRLEHLTSVFFCSMVLVGGSSERPVAHQPLWPRDDRYGYSPTPGAMDLLTRSLPLLEHVVDVVHLAQALEERDEVQEFSVGLVIEPGLHGDLEDLKQQNSESVFMFRHTDSKTEECEKNHTAFSGWKT